MKINQYKFFITLWTCLAFAALPAICLANENCNLVRILAGEAAYQECIGSSDKPLVDEDTPLITPSTASVNLSRLDPKQLYKLLSPSAYIVIAAKNREDFIKGENLSQGSAIAVSEKFLLTAYHVIDDLHAIVICQKENFARARIIRSEPSSDICVLESLDLKLTPIKAIRPFNKIEVGEKVYTLGAPRGLEQTIGEGIVSGKRSLKGEIGVKP